MMALPSRASNQKLAYSPLKTFAFSVRKCPVILLAGLFATVSTAVPQDEPLGNEEHEREELGVNPYTAPSIARIFQQLDNLKPLRFDQLKRDLPASISASREQKGLIFGELIADGFLIVATERKNLVEEFGRALLREGRALGVAERVMRHSASLTELGRRGDWAKVRKELIATQTDVEQAMVELRDEKMAHLISLGGWLRGLEISSVVVTANFSTERAKILAQPDLANYFTAEVKTLPPALVHTPLFEKIRAAIQQIDGVVGKSANLSINDVKTVQAAAKSANDAIRRVD
jgi:phosphoglycolate phosphatase-like HAD superfamily hydrolase